MRVIAHWARSSNERAAANAREAATEASRRRVEAAEVTAYVEAVWGRADREIPAEQLRTATER